jgi:hypothetical protein
MRIHVWAALGVVLMTGCGQDATDTDDMPEAASETAAPAEPAAPPAAAAPAAAAPASQRTPAPAGATAYFISPADGDVVSSPVRVVFGLSGFGVAPAGVPRDDAGHHHLLVDTGLPENLDAPVPADANHVHFGGGQTETELELAPGTHTLQLLLGDASHVPHDPPITSQRITIEVR